MKKWVTVMMHKGYEIQILKDAGALDPLGYRLQPELIGHEGESFDTVGAAIESIENAVYII